MATRILSRFLGGALKVKNLLAGIASSIPPLVTELRAKGQVLRGKLA